MSSAGTSAVQTWTCRSSGVAWYRCAMLSHLARKPFRWMLVCSAWSNGVQKRDLLLRRKRPSSDL